MTKHSIIPHPYRPRDACFATMTKINGIKSTTNHYLLFPHPYQPRDTCFATRTPPDQMTWSNRVVSDEQLNKSLYMTLLRKQKTPCGIVSISNLLTIRVLLLDMWVLATR